MVAYKKNPAQNKDYKKQDYRLAASITGTQYNPSHNGSIPASSSIDGIVQPPGADEIYQKRIEPLSLTRDYYLTQPIWFEEIIKRLANDNAKKTEKEKPHNNRHYGNLN